MGLFEFCIRRPVFATVLSLVLILLGIVSYGRLTVREYPNVDEPVVSVSTSYPGASATIVESQITQVLEGSLAGISGIDVLESTSRAETSRITVRFNSDIDPDVAANDVRDRVSRVRRRLPVEVLEPTIAKVEADAQADHEPRLHQRPHVAAGDHRFRRPLRHRSLQEPARRRRRHDLRRAALCHAHLDRPRAAGGLQPHGAGHRECAAHPECRAALRPHREPRPRVLGSVPHRPRHARAVPQHRHQDRRRPSGEARRGGASRARRGRRAAQQLLQRPAGHHGRHRQAGGRQSARRLQRHPQGAARDQPVAAAGPDAPASATTAPCSSTARSRPSITPSPRRSCWWCW